MTKFLDKTGLAYLWSKITALVSPKADKDTDAVVGNVAIFDANGNAVDSGKTLGTSVPADALFNSGVFVCNLTGNIYQGTATMDKTPSEIVSAYNSGMTVICRSSDITYYLVTCGLTVSENTPYYIFRSIINTGSNMSFNYVRYINGVLSASMETWASKANKVSNAVNGHLAGLDSNGYLTDSGYSPSDFVTSENAPRIITPQSGTIMSMTAAEIENLRVGDIVKDYTNNIAYKDFFVVSTKVMEVILVYIDQTMLFPTIFTKSGNSWGYDMTKSITFSDLERKTTTSTSQPQGGMKPNVLYNLGELSADTTFTLAAAIDNTIANVWEWTFSFGATTYNITWPSGITWASDSQPTLVANRNYQIRVMNGIASCVWSSIPTP